MHHNRNGKMHSEAQAMHSEAQATNKTDREK